MKRIVVFALLLCSWSGVYAQDWAKAAKVLPTEVALQVGDKIPFTELHGMLNYPKSSYKFSDHKAKLTILDFWSTTCGPCIKFWPTALKLQEEFGTDLQMILVNAYENPKKVKAFLEKRKRIDGFAMTLPISVRDSTRWKNFPSGVLPRYVWITDDGVVRAITHTTEVTSENIKKWIAGSAVKFNNIDEKKYYSVKPSVPIFLNGNGGERSSDVFVFSSSITRGQDDMSVDSNISYDSMAGYSINVINSPIFYLYGYAYNYRLRDFDFFDYLTPSRMKLISRDSSKYYGDGTLAGGSYNYQLISKLPKSRNELLDIMREDLKRCFSLDVKWEKEMRKCLVFSMFDSTLATKTKGIAGEGQMRHGKIVVDSLTVKDVMTMMEMGTGYYRERLYPIIDETGYKGVITGIRVNSDVYDPATLDKIFSKHGIRLKFEMREVDVLVLREPEKRTAKARK